MRLFNEYTQAQEAPPKHALADYDPDYALLLQRWQIPFTLNGHYLQVGNIPSVTGWILDVSAIETDVFRLLQTIIPVLMYERVPFKIPINEEVSKALLAGVLGYPEIGKIICLFPGSPDRAAQIARILLKETKGFKGPAIPTDYNLGGVLFARYGGYNPIQLADSDGITQLYTYNDKGVLTPDVIPVPFDLPNGVNWPFFSIRPYRKMRAKRFLNKKYLVVHTLKSDAKGKVLRAFQFKNWFSVHPCIIKEGVKYMSSDASGRDARDRTKWQYELHKILKNDIPIPAALDYFSENGNDYFVMAVAEGHPLSEVINGTYQSNHWDSLPNDSQEALYKYFLIILDLVAKLHERGYYHRDLSPRNFLVSKEEKITCIDLELSWDFRAKKPDPPFVLGTAGYMAPEQIRQEDPTLEQDVFGLGGLLVRIFTSLSPKLFNIEDGDTLYHHLLYLTGNRQLAALICACLSPVPTDRPNVSEIRQSVIRCCSRNRIGPKKETRKTAPPSTEDCRDIVERAIAGLGSVKMVTPEQIWFSKATRKAKFIANESLETSYQTGISKGVAGPLYLLAVARSAGYSIDRAKEHFTYNWQYLHANRFHPDASLISGLYNGSAGVSLAFLKGVEASLIKMPTEMQATIANGFVAPTQDLSIAGGIAGQGLAILQCLNCFEGSNVNGIISQYVQQIFAAQQKDGSWIIQKEGFKKGIKLFSFSYGIAGIIYFLLKAYEYTKENWVLNGALKGLEFLERHQIVNSGKISWNICPKSKVIDPWLEYGVTGITIPFIKAYTITQDAKYKSTTEAALSGHNRYLITPFLSVGTGAAGIGQLYLDAYQAFQADEWKERADQIAQLILHIFQPQPDGSVCWITDNTPLPTADLMTGSSGVIHFLMRYASPEQFNLPIFN